jgi:hypothetical protein
MKLGPLYNTQSSIFLYNTQSSIFSLLKNYGALVNFTAPGHTILTIVVYEF